MSGRHRRHRRFKLRSFYVWHRYMGVSAAIFVLLIAVTGALLNHTEDFAFDSRHVGSAWILDWYGIKAPDRLLSYAAGDRQVTLIEDRLYLDRHTIEGAWQSLHGAVDVGDIVVVAVDNAILLITPFAQIIERLQGDDAVPAGIEQIGTDSNGALMARSGSQLFQADEDIIRWAPWQGDAAAIIWSHPVAVSPALKSSLQQDYRNRILPLERVLLDLHSGRFFGKAGPWVFDVAALLLILLALSGTLIWLKRKR